MKILIVVLGCMAAAACSNDSSSTSPTAFSEVGSGATAAVNEGATGDPNHFDPRPFRGYDSAKWHDLTNKSPKYVFGRALVGLDVNTENLKRVAEKQGLEYLGKDLVAFPDGTVIDCIYDVDGRRADWQWQLSH